ncbi:MAG: hypothetical protein AAFZ04_16565 [Pseudomonadota bacterium]
MSSISEDDWDAVNAFHDGEMPGKDRAAFEARLRQEPALAQALEDVQGLSRGLGALKPRTAVPDTAPTRSGLWFGAIAASLALLAVALWSLQDRSPGLLDLHHALEGQGFYVATEDIRNVGLARDFGVHDLTGANLAPVAAHDIADGQLAHYAGVNGCRLTYFRLSGPAELPPGASARAVAWTTDDGAHHAIIATGMDLQKFDAIATYLQHLTHDLSKTRVYASMAQATQDAAPCVG